MTGNKTSGNRNKLLLGKRQFGVKTTSTWFHLENAIWSDFHAIFFAFFSNMFSKHYFNLKHFSLGFFSYTFDTTVEKLSVFEYMCLSLVVTLSNQFFFQLIVIL